MPVKIDVYDTTLRDGSQGEGISFSVEDKVKIARRLDAFGMDFIEGGWPGAVPKDTEFFARLRAEPLRHAKLAAFGSTRKAHATAATDANLIALLQAETPVVTIVGKASAWQVTEALRVSLEEGLAMIADSVALLEGQGREVIYDAEHFFDGYKMDPDYALRALDAAAESGASVLCLCDTNGGTLPHEIYEIVTAVRQRFGGGTIGMHPHNDADCGTANALAAVRAGATQVQGTINGYGERTGNASILSIAAALRLKMGLDCLTNEAMRDMTRLSAFVDEVANVTPNPKAAYVGRNAFTHKAGLHADAIAKAPRAYDHIEPTDVGNVRRLLVSEQAGSATIAQKAADLGYALDKKSPEARAVLSEVTAREHEGYAFEGAEASFELLLQKATGRYRKLFDLLAFRVLVERRAGDAEPITEATLRLRVGDEEFLTVAEGDGPIHALDGALRAGLLRFYPQLSRIRLTDFKVRVVTMGEGTAAKVRTIVESTADHGATWSTVGVSTNIIESSYQALVDAIEYGLLKESE
ncbi:MAG: citramalate synthase [Cytophagales bacterium]|nr:citramalate synthase [Armatimonadota bacterium]